jgi:hypothetical protein
MSMNLTELQLKELFANRLFSYPLRSTSGKKVEILQIGEANCDAGPDFKRALIRIDGVTMRGEIELHIKSSYWISHSHNEDRNYNGVVLHVVLECDDMRTCRVESGREIETVDLSKFLLPEAEQFLQKKEQHGEEGTGSVVRLRCAGKNSSVPSKEKLAYLKLLGEKRFMHKVNRFNERLKDIVDENRPVIFEAKQRYFRDFSELLIEHKTYEKCELQDENYWDQLLYESIFEGLGYSKNTMAFGKLARNVTLAFLKEHSVGDEKIIEAILYGVAGLLPSTVEGFDDESKSYCSELQQIWQGIKKKYKREFVDKSEWLFFKLRPQNFPTLRIAGMSRIISDEKRNFSSRGLLQQQAREGSLADLLLWRRTIRVEADGYWSRHFVFGIPSSTKVKMLIGANRVEEIIINSLLPLTYLRGMVFEDGYLQEAALGTYRSHSPTSDNSITLLVKEYLFDGDNVFDNVVAQQGALHLYRSLCSERRCLRCKIGKAIFKA